MTRRRLYSTLLVLLTFIAAIVLARLIWAIVAPFTDILLLFAAAWLIAFILRPWAYSMSHSRPATRLVIAAHRRWGNARAETIAHLLDPLAVTLIYLVLLAALVIALVAIIPMLFREARQLGATLTSLLEKLPDWLTALQNDLSTRFEASPDFLSRLYRLQDMNQQITVLAQGIPRMIAGAIRGIAAGIGEFLLTLALSYYLMLDGPRLARQIHDLTPQRFHDEYDLLVSTISRTFGGFLRGQLVMALLSGLVSGIAAGVAGLRYGAIIGALAGLIIFIPVIGAPIAMFLPSLIALLQGASLLKALVLLAFLTAFQQILLHLIVPRIMSESIGMPTALILLSTLIGARLWGVWGFIFGIPVAGAIYTTALIMLGRFKRAQDQLDQERHNLQN